MFKENNQLENLFLQNFLCRFCEKRLVFEHDRLGAEESGGNSGEEKPDEEDSTADSTEVEETDISTIKLELFGTSEPPQKFNEISGGAISEIKQTVSEISDPELKKQAEAIFATLGKEFEKIIKDDFTEQELNAFSESLTLEVNKLEKVRSIAILQEQKKEFQQDLEVKILEISLNLTKDLPEELQNPVSLKIDEALKNGKFGAEIIKEYDDEITNLEKISPEEIHTYVAKTITDAEQFNDLAVKENLSSYPDSELIYHKQKTYAESVAWITTSFQGIEEKFASKNGGEKYKAALEKWKTEFNSLSESPEKITAKSQEELSELIDQAEHEIVLGLIVDKVNQHKSPDNPGTLTPEKLEEFLNADVNYAAGKFQSKEQENAQKMLQLVIAAVQEFELTDLVQIRIEAGTDAAKMNGFKGENKAVYIKAANEILQSPLAHSPEVTKHLAELQKIIREGENYEMSEQFKASDGTGNLLLNYLRISSVAGKDLAQGKNEYPVDLSLAINLEDKEKGEKHRFSRIRFSLKSGPQSPNEVSIAAADVSEDDRNIGNSDSSTLDPSAAAPDAQAEVAQEGERAKAISDILSENLPKVPGEIYYDARGNSYEFTEDGEILLSLSAADDNSNFYEVDQETLEYFIDSKPFTKEKVEQIIQEKNLGFIQYDRYEYDYNPASGILNIYFIKGDKEIAVEYSLLNKQVSSIEDYIDPFLSADISDEELATLISQGWQLEIEEGGSEILTKINAGNYQEALRMILDDSGNLTESATESMLAACINLGGVNDLNNQPINPKLLSQLVIDGLINLNENNNFEKYQKNFEDDALVKLALEHSDELPLDKIIQNLNADSANAENWNLFVDRISSEKTLIHKIVDHKNSSDYFLGQIVKTAMSNNVEIDFTTIIESLNHIDDFVSKIESDEEIPQDIKAALRTEMIKLIYSKTDYDNNHIEIINKIWNENEIPVEIRPYLLFKDPENYRLEDELGKIPGNEISTYLDSFCKILEAQNISDINDLSKYSKLWSETDSDLEKGVQLIDHLLKIQSPLALNLAITIQGKINNGEIPDEDNQIEKSEEKERMLKMAKLLLDRIFDKNISPEIRLSYTRFILSINNWDNSMIQKIDPNIVPGNFKKTIAQQHFKILAEIDSNKANNEIFDEPILTYDSTVNITLKEIADLAGIEQTHPDRLLYEMRKAIDEGSFKINYSNPLYTNFINNLGQFSVPQINSILRKIYEHKKSFESEELVSIANLTGHYSLAEDLIKEDIGDESIKQYYLAQLPKYQDQRTEMLTKAYRKISDITGDNIILNISRKLIEDGVTKIKIDENSEIDLTDDQGELKKLAERDNADIQDRITANELLVRINLKNCENGNCDPGKFLAAIDKYSAVIAKRDEDSGDMDFELYNKQDQLSEAAIKSIDKDSLKDDQSKNIYAETLYSLINKTNPDQKYVEKFIALDEEWLPKDNEDLIGDYNFHKREKILGEQPTSPDKYDEYFDAVISKYNSDKNSEESQKLVLDSLQYANSEKLKTLISEISSDKFKTEIYLKAHQTNTTIEAEDTIFEAQKLVLNSTIEKVGKENLKKVIDELIKIGSNSKAIEIMVNDKYSSEFENKEKLQILSADGAQVDDIGDAIKIIEEDITSSSKTAEEKTKIKEKLTVILETNAKVLQALPEKVKAEYFLILAEGKSDKEIPEIKTKLDFNGTISEAETIVASN